jgi:hypothetical protein
MKKELTFGLYKKPTTSDKYKWQLSLLDNFQSSTPYNTFAQDSLLSETTKVNIVISQISVRKQKNKNEETIPIPIPFYNYNSHTLGTRRGFLAAYSHNLLILRSLGSSSCYNTVIINNHNHNLYKFQILQLHSNYNYKFSINQMIH